MGQRGRRSFLEIPTGDRIRTALRKRVRLTRKQAASEGGCSPKWTDIVLQGLISDGMARFEPPQGPGAFKGDYRDVDREVMIILTRWALAEQVHALFGNPSPELEGLAVRWALWSIKWRWRLQPFILEAIRRAALAARTEPLPTGVDGQPYRLGLPSWAGERLLETMDADPPPPPLSSMEFVEFRDRQRRILFRWLEGETD